MSTGGPAAQPPTAPAGTSPSARGQSGRARWEARGCLAAKGEAPARAFEVEPGRRALPEPPLVEPAPGGARVRHAFTHACCLAGAVQVVRHRAFWEVRETLSGTPCRCVCASTLETRVTLPAGVHRLRLVLVRDGESQVVHEATVEVRR